MSLHIYNDLEQGTNEWHDARRGIVTASIIGKLLTPTLKVADNDTSRGVTLTLAAERITGHTDYVHPSFDMQRGTEEEPIARDAYSEHHAPVTECGFMVREFDGYKIGYSPDGLVGEDGLIEVKSRKPKEHLKTILDGKPPAENMAQLMAGLLVSGRDWIDYISFSAGLPLWTTRVHPDDAWFGAITAAAVTAETNIGDTITRYNTETHGLPMTERRPDIEEMRI